MKTYAQNHQLKSSFSFAARLKSFKHAFRGILLLFIKEANAKIQLCVGIVAIALAIVLQLNSFEWIILIACIGWVLFAEAINTVIENFADFIHPEYHLKIKNIKDLAAGAVLISACATAIIGAILFIPKIIKLLL